MAHDPYGYDSDLPPPPTEGSPALHVLAGCSTFAWLGSAIAWCGLCSGALAFSPPDEKTWLDQVGVWLILVAPAWPLAAIGLWTAALHGVARRWWTSAGPNVVVGTITGSALWVVVLVAWAALTVAQK